VKIRLISVVACALALAQACAGSTRGVRAEAPGDSAIVARVSVKEPNGLLVLANGQTGGRDFDWKGWIANDALELGVLWKAVGRGHSPPPVVDFSRYIVFGAAGIGGVEPAKFVGIAAKASGELALEYDQDSLFSTGNLVAVRVALVVAVPRRMVRGPVVYFKGYRFLVEEPFLE
jgi:hypothetical protein